MERLRIGIIGCGLAGRMYLDAIRRNSDRCDLAWVADANEAAMEAFARETHCRVLTDYHEGLQDCGAVLVCTPHHLHASQSIDAFKAGCHVYVEKPIATTRKDAELVIAAAEESNRVLMVGLGFRFRPLFVRLKEAVDSGRWGKPFLIDCRLEENQTPVRKEWMRHREMLGGGILFSAGCHFVDLLIWLLGDVDSGDARGNRLDSRMEGEESVAAVFQFASGAVASIALSWCVPHPDPWIMVRVLCEKGTLEATVTDTPQLHSRLTAIGETREILYDAPGGYEFHEPFEYFLTCIESGREPLTSGRESLKSLNAIWSATRPDGADGGSGDP